MAISKKAKAPGIERLLRSLPGFDPYRESAGFEFRADLAFEKLEFWETYVTHIEGDMAGKPYRLEPHEAAIVANIFGWIDPLTGLRRFREVLYYVPRGNSKTTFAAALCLMVLFTEPDWRMQLFSCGSDGEQAAIVYEMMVAMIEAQPELEKRVRIYKSPKRVILLADRSTYRPLSADAKTKHGRNANFAIYDETHTYPNGRLIEAVHTSMVKRKQPLEIHCTTAGEEGPSVLNKIYHRMCQVRDGLLPGPRCLPVIYEVPKAVRDADPLYWTKPANWAIANPLLGKALSTEYFEDEINKAKLDPQAEEGFKRLHLNVQTSIYSRMIETEWWNLNDGDYRAADFEGQQVAGAGLDLGMVSDMCSLCLLFGNSSKGFKALWWHWIPEKAARRYEMANELPYTQWQRDGWVKITPGDEIDYDQILFDIAGPTKEETDPARRKMKGIGQRYKICLRGAKGKQDKGLAVDRLFQGAAVCQQLIKRGWIVEEFGQGYYSMTAPTAEFRSYLKRGMWAHGNNPMMRWQMSNVVAETNVTGDMKPSKAKSHGKIDGIVTAVMAMGVALRSEMNTEHAYSKRGLRWLDRGKRWGKFWITAEELGLIQGAAEGLEREEIMEGVFARHGYSVGDHRPNPLDQREFTAVAL